VQMTSFVNVVLRELLESYKLNGVRLTKHVARMGEMRNAGKILIAKRAEKVVF
jgi:Na+-transporting NADH:ubiquinone oxidoreductase subunit NqrD